MHVVELGPQDASELAALYDGHEWWADRTPREVRNALRETEIALGVHTPDLAAATRC